MKFQRHLLKNTGFKRLAKFRTASLQIKEAVTPTGTSKYFYDGAGRRVAKEVNGTRSDYLLMGSEVLKTYENGAPKAEYFLGLGRHGIKTNNSWKYYLTDGLGSTVSLTDDTGSTVAAYDYDDYGETTQIAGDSSVYNPFLYTGQEWDAELGMYNLRARHYSPTLGRFIARDPIGHAGGSNLYAYCNGDPVNFSDPSGLKPCRTVNVSLNPAQLALLNAQLGLDSTSFEITQLDVLTKLRTELPGVAVSMNAPRNGSYNVDINVRNAQFHAFQGGSSGSSLDLSTNAIKSQTQRVISTPSTGPGGIRLPSFSYTLGGTAADKRENALQSIVTGVALGIGGHTQQGNFAAPMPTIPSSLLQSVIQRL